MGKTRLGIEVVGGAGEAEQWVYVLAHWITDRDLPRRFDVPFLVARMPEGQQPVADTADRDDARAGVAQHVLPPFPRQREVERDVPGARLEDGEERHHGIGRAVEADAHPPLRCETEAAQVAGEVGRAQGNHHPSIAPYGLFHCGDGAVQIALGSEGLWKKFCAGFDLDPEAEPAGTRATLDRFYAATAAVLGPPNVTRSFMWMVEVTRCASRLTSLKRF